MNPRWDILCSVYDYRADEEKTHYETSAKAQRGSAGRGFLCGSNFGWYKERVAMEYFGIRWTAVSPATIVRFAHSSHCLNFFVFVLLILGRIYQCNNMIRYPFVGNGCNASAADCTMSRLFSFIVCLLSKVVRVYASVGPENTRKFIIRFQGITRMLF